jgi:hypothetical protein
LHVKTTAQQYSRNGKSAAQLQAEADRHKLAEFEALVASNEGRLAPEEAAKMSSSELALAGARVLIAKFGNRKPSTTNNLF